ncbi:MAG TPA: 3-oxoadipate enol-lactonase [Verrucomicrobiae bacterium]|nr:3-oxoadipate enol-lactonase [Verrucomicrobiae bacterium]
MAIAEAHGIKIEYRFDGDETAPVLVLSHSLGADHSMWAPQAAAFARKFRVLRYDTRGHGSTDVTPGPYAIEMLARDLLGLLDSLEIERAHFCGLSLGGTIGMWLGVHAPGRIERLVVCNTAPKIGTTETWNARIAQVREGGMASIAETQIGRWFTPEFAARAPEAVEGILKLLRKCSPEGYIGCCAALRDADLREEIGKIHNRTLIIGGSRDPVSTAADSQFMAGRIAGAKFAELEASHLSNVEAAERFNEAALRFLTERE